MDTTDPHIRFDKDGVSNHYHDFVQNVKPHWKPGTEGKAALERAVEKVKRMGKGQEFDCLLGLSGGIDSCYMLHVIVREFGLRPLVFHVDGGWNSELAVHNIQVMIERLNLELYTEVINWDEMRDFQLAWIKAGVPHIDLAQDHAFIAVLYNFAEKYRIKTILNGGNISTECVRYPLQYFYWGTDMRHIRDIVARFGTIPMATYPFSSVFRHKLYLRYVKNVRVLKPLNLMPYVRNVAVKTLQEHYGWKPYPQKHFESRFTKFYEGYWLPTRFGYDVRRVQLSSLILTGQMTREEALQKLSVPSCDPLTASRDFEYVATKLGISVDELTHYRDMPRKYYWDYKNNQKVLAAMETAARILRAGRRGGAF